MLLIIFLKEVTKSIINFKKKKNEKEISQVNDTLENDKKKKSQEKSMWVHFTQNGPHSSII